MTNFTEKQNRTEKIILRMRPDELEQLQLEAERVAKAEGRPCNRSALIRRALDCYFDQQDFRGKTRLMRKMEDGFAREMKRRHRKKKSAPKSRPGPRHE